MLLAIWIPSVERPYDDTTKRSFHEILYSLLLLNFNKKVLKTMLQLCYFFFSNTLIEEATIEIFFEAFSSFFSKNQQTVDISILYDFLNLGIQTV